MQPPDELCRLALDLAREAYDHDEIPVGCVLYRPEAESPATGAAVNSAQAGADAEDTAAVAAYEILASGRNRIAAGTDATLHAEIQAISRACSRAESERLPGCFLVTTLEPCMMCTGALVLARIEAVYYFTPVLTGVGMSELLNHSREQRRFNHYPTAQMLESYQRESAELLRSFFQKKRELHRARKLDELLAAREN